MGPPVCHGWDDPGCRCRGLRLRFPQTLGAIVAGCEAARAFFAGVFKALLADNIKPLVAQANATNPRFTVGWLEYGQARASVTDPAGSLRRKTNPGLSR